MSTLLSPRPMPERRLPVAAGAVALALALPVFLLAGWDVRGWALGAVLWVGSQALRGSGVVAFGMMTRGIAIVLVALFVAVSNPDLAVAAILVYAFAYSLELAISLTLYFSGEPRR